MAIRATRQIRVHDDLGEMLADIHDVTGEQIAEIVDPHLRPAIEQRHKELLPAIKQIRAARNRHAKREAVSSRYDLGGEAG